ncbi:MerR family transcriptional regulator [Paenibacillus sacheonensis]|uniref:MerR family transcriptional regulator n=1 Tax=Paenibacillus sacheonensis TaxID=742054 RepID=A0A7X5C2K1_9BACL|nr:MerR family transcriptional regulator [Paenibacillus sacheonensis]MBM7566252.1 DNA-binding transcriptional MerR regulator [Paenibacillus sacheonensis]NBC70459.1 MerR family transcriptional regulator [Paenibacillus sacheonensis]
MKTTHTIQQVTKITGLSAHTLRYYEKISLIRDIEREGNGYRYYSEKDVEWLQFLIRLRDTGMPIRDMQRFAELRYRGNETVAERRQMLERHKHQIREHIDRLLGNIEALNEKTDYYRELEKER